jgi:hypothetical protein
MNRLATDLTANTMLAAMKAWDQGEPFAPSSIMP